METNKIIRSICYFSKSPESGIMAKLNELEKKLIDKGFLVQTKRICSGEKSFESMYSKLNDDNTYLSIGSIATEEANRQFDDFCKT